MLSVTKMDVTFTLALHTKSARAMTAQHVWKPQLLNVLCLEIQNYAHFQFELSLVQF